MAAGDVLLEIVGDLHPTGRGGGILVRADGNKLHVAFHLAGPHQIRHKDEGALQHAQKQRIFILKLLIQGLTHLRDPGMEFLLGHQHLQNILFHLTSHDRSPLFVH